MANVLMNLGALYDERRDFDPAEKYLQEAQQIRRGALAKDSLDDSLTMSLRRDVARGNYNLARMYNAWAGTLVDQAEALESADRITLAEEKYDAADSLFDKSETQIREAIALLTALIGHEATMEDEYLLAMSYRVLGEFLRQFDGDQAEARSAFRAAETQMESLQRRNPKVTTYREELSDIQQLLQEESRVVPDPGRETH